LLPIGRLAVAGIAVLVGAAALRIALVETPDGGRPVVEVPISSTENANRVAGANASPGAGAISVGPELPLEAVKAALAGGGAETDTLDLGDLNAFGVDPDLVEETAYGPIPRISAGGETPFATYARPSVSPGAAGGKPLVAIIVTGLGINLSGTLEAVATLPDTVTLAFAPYGKSLDRTVGAARAEGHEIYLEVPLEPFDFPDNDPGPDTLLTGLAPRENMDKLYRVMTKFGGYAGVINNMGARFTASAADFAPMMEELGARGLSYLDDGSSNRSLAPQLSSANRVPFAKADLVLDSNPARASILSQLEALEQRARQEGYAIGLAAALPVSVQTIAEWAATAEDKGLLIVPASALMQK
jgi:polysaccharide deacetylase 2 family uncharacterized protein YibQ